MVNSTWLDKILRNGCDLCAWRLYSFHS